MRERTAESHTQFIIDMKEFKEKCIIDVEDISKRLMDYGFHSPTVSFPVHDTMMIEPTESESKAELDRFADALISIKKEIAEVADGTADKTDNVLKKICTRLQRRQKTIGTIAVLKTKQSTLFLKSVSINFGPAFDESTTPTATKTSCAAARRSRCRLCRRAAQ